MLNFLPNIKRNFHFSSKSTARIVQEEFVGRWFLMLSETRWNYSSWQVSILSYKITVFSELFSAIWENPDYWNASELTQTSEFVAILEDFQFKFLLVIFETMLSSPEIVFTILKKKSLYISRCIRKINNIKVQLVVIKNRKFEEFYSQ